MVKQMTCKELKDYLTFCKICGSKSLESLPDYGHRGITLNVHTFPFLKKFYTKLKEQNNYMRITYTDITQIFPFLSLELGHTGFFIDNDNLIFIIDEVYPVERILKFLVALEKHELLGE